MRRKRRWKGPAVDSHTMESVLETHLKMRIQRDIHVLWLACLNSDKHTTKSFADFFEQVGSLLSGSKLDEVVDVSHPLRKDVDDALEILN